MEVKNSSAKNVEADLLKSILLKRKLNKAGGLPTDKLAVASKLTLAKVNKIIVELKTANEVREVVNKEGTTVYSLVASPTPAPTKKTDKPTKVSRTPKSEPKPKPKSKKVEAKAETETAEVDIELDIEVASIPAPVKTPGAPKAAAPVETPVAEAETDEERKKSEYIKTHNKNRKFEKYYFRGTEFRKGKLVLELVKQYVASRPRLTEAKMREELTPLDLVKNWGLIAELAIARKANDSGKQRYHANASDHLTIGACKYCCTNQISSENFKVVIEKFIEIGVIANWEEVTTAPDLAVES